MKDRFTETRIYEYPDNINIKVERVYKEGSVCRKRLFIRSKEGKWEQLCYVLESLNGDPQNEKLIEGSWITFLPTGEIIKATSFHPRDLSKKGPTLVYIYDSHREDYEELHIYTDPDEELRKAEEEWGLIEGYNNDEYDFPNIDDYHSHTSFCSQGNLCVLRYDRPIAAMEDPRSYQFGMGFNISAEP